MVGNLRVVASTHIPRVIGILEEEGTFVLTELDGKFLPVRPLHEVVLHVEGGVVHLCLNAVLEVREDGAIDIHTNESLAEACTAMCSGLIAVGILPDEVAAKLGCRSIVGQFPAQLWLCIRSGSRTLKGIGKAVIHQFGDEARAWCTVGFKLTHLNSLISRLDHVLLLVAFSPEWQEGKICHKGKSENFSHNYCH